MRENGWGNIRKGSFGSLFIACLFTGIGGVTAQKKHQRPDLLEKWRKAVADSPEIKWLKTLDKGPGRLVVDGVAVGVSKRKTEYLLRGREIWARSYSQWVAKKSGDKVILDQLNDIINIDAQQQLPLGSQWRDENFQPISDAIDDLFKDMGWIE